MKVVLPFFFLSFVSSVYLRSGHRDHLCNDDGITFQEKNETLTDDYVLTLPRGENENYYTNISFYVYDRINDIEVNDYDVTIVFDP